MMERYRSVYGARRVQATTGWSRRRRAVVAGVAAITLGLVAAALCRPADPPTPRPAEPQSREFLGFDPSRDTAEPSAGTASLHAAATTPTAARRVDGQVEVCGLGLVATSVDDPDGGAHVPPAQRDDAARLLAAALAAAADERAQAAGRLLRLRALREDGSDQAAADAGGTLAELAGAAAQGGDPAVYAAALEACGQASAPAPAACAGLSANRWASLEPSNAAPWLRIAQEARDAGDDDALAAAVYQVSLAKRIDWHEDDLALAALRAIPAGAAPLARALDARAISQARDGWAAPAYGGLAAFCAPGVDANRDQLCEASARLLLRPSARPYEARLGARMGRSLGWPARQLDDLRLRRDALDRIDVDPPADAQPYSCAAAAQLQQWAATRQRLGETGARRALVADAGQRLDDAVVQLRALRASRAARVAAAQDEP